MTVTQRLDPLGDATRAMPEIKITGAQLMDLVDERDAARQALWDIYGALGCDQDGDATPRAVVGDLGKLVLEAAQEYRADTELDAEGLDRERSRMRSGIQALIDHHGQDSDGTTSGWWRSRLADLLEG